MYQISLNKISKMNMIAVQLRWLIIFYFNIKFLAQRDELSSVLSTVEAM